VSQKEKADKLQRLVVGIIQRLREEMKDRQVVSASRLEILLSDIQTFGLTEFWD
jgi:hypothetical protein